MNLLPRREAMQMQSGNWLVTVTPPEWSHFHASSVILTPDQYRRFCDWLEGGKLIQEALPDLSPDQREVLLSGIGAAEQPEWM